MTPLQTLLDACLTLRADGERLIVSPASLLDDTLRNLIRANKVELLAAARDAEVTFSNLIAAIRTCCDLRGDDDRNRDALLAESASLSREHQLDMTAHFLSEAAIWRRVTGAAS